MKTQKTIKLFSFCLFFTIICFCQSCNEPSIPSSSGNASEILVVIPKNYKNSVCLSQIKDCFEQEQQGLPQQEKMFDVISIDKSLFNKKIFQTHRNIFIANIKDSIGKPVISIKKNVWSKPQIVVEISTPDDSSFYKLLKDKQDIIIDYYKEIERSRIINAYKQYEDKKLENKLEKSFHLSFVIPNGFYIAKQTDNFAWIRKETTDMSQDIIIYFYDYTDTVAFDNKKIITIRDSITKLYVPGPTDGSYMTTYKDIFPVSKRISYNNNFAVETRGLWRVENDFMGGPFVNYTFVNQNKVITLDGFVYAPKFDKKKYLLQLEAILYSFKFTETNSAQISE
jgi:hypothetical protein